MILDTFGIKVGLDVNFRAFTFQCLRGLKLLGPRAYRADRILGIEGLGLAVEGSKFDFKVMIQGCKDCRWGPGVPKMSHGGNPEDE